MYVAGRLRRGARQLSGSAIGNHRSSAAERRAKQSQRVPQIAIVCLPGNHAQAAPLRASRERVHFGPRGCGVTERVVCARGSDAVRSRASLIMPNVCADSAIARSGGRSWPSGAGSVKPSAQPTLVGTQHLPPAKAAGPDRYAKMARPLKVSGVMNRRLSLPGSNPAPGATT